jgi:hypothetical protein
MMVQGHAAVTARSGDCRGGDSSSDPQKRTAPFGAGAIVFRGRKPWHIEELLNSWMIVNR